MRFAPHVDLILCQTETSSLLLSAQSQRISSRRRTLITKAILLSRSYPTPLLRRLTLQCCGLLPCTDNPDQASVRSVTFRLLISHVRAALDSRPSLCQRPPPSPAFLSSRDLDPSSVSSKRFVSSGVDPATGSVPSSSSVPSGSAIPSCVAGLSSFSNPSSASSLYARPQSGGPRVSRRQVRLAQLVCREHQLNQLRVR